MHIRKGRDTQISKARQIPSSMRSAIALLSKTRMRTRMTMVATIIKTTTTMITERRMRRAAREHGAESRERERGEREQRDAKSSAEELETSCCPQTRSQNRRTVHCHEICCYAVLFAPVYPRGTCLGLSEMTDAAHARMALGRHLFRHRPNGFLASWVPSPSGKHTFQNCIT